ncbi:MAG: hypothetical protein WD512_01230 [Candidatus Paceibacterota bacterium]
MSKAEEIYFRAIVMLLPKAYCQYNVSFTSVGEKHLWMYDFYTLNQILRNAGYKEVQTKTATTSDKQNFPFYQLDLKKNGKPRKGFQSIYVEAQKV